MDAADDADEWRQIQRGGKGVDTESGEKGEFGGGNGNVGMKA